MHENKFNQEDKEKFIQFLNMVASHAKFTLDTKEIIEYFKLITHMQKTILPKMDANILEVVRVVEPEEKEKGKL